MSESGRVGVDVGGTFTDVVTVVDGELSVTKVPSVPDTPEEGVFDGLERSDRPFASVDVLAHGTTVATNAVLERDWASTALVTTDGFRDVLEIGRQARPALYDLDVHKPDPVVPRSRRFEVDERVTDRGAVAGELDDVDLEETVSSLLATDVDSVAVCLLFAFENDEHERRIVETIREADPSLSLSRSSVVHPEIREFERTLVTALNAGLKPVIDRYLGRLETGVQERNPDVALRVMQSNGGSVGADLVRQRPIDTVLSGPAAGVQGAAHVASLAGHENVITMDMGGTSCDVSVVQHGDPVTSTDVSVGGYPISRPMVEVHTIGAGGGSIAWIDEGGALRVGPQSAGADPGPICYGRGGTEPTVTDAQVVLGRIDPDAFLADGFDAAPEAAREGIASSIADELGVDPPEAAAGILAVANANMERAIRVVTVERGLDPRDFALVAFGGAGPLHAPAIARSLDIPTVLVPRAAGVLSALGLVIADLVREFSTSRVRPWSAADPTTLNEAFAGFIERGSEELLEEGVSPERISVERALDLRYVGQSFTLRVPVSGPLDDETMSAVERAFHERHDTRYGHASPDEPIELVTLRVQVRGTVSAPDIRMNSTGPHGGPDPRTRRPVTIDEEREDVDVFDRAAVGPGTQITGPAVIEGPESTALVYHDQRAEVDEYGTVAIRADGGTA